MRPLDLSKTTRVEFTLYRFSMPMHGPLRAALESNRLSVSFESGVFEGS